LNSVAGAFFKVFFLNFSRTSAISELRPFPWPSRPPLPFLFSDVARTLPYNMTVFHLFYVNHLGCLLLAMWPGLSFLKFLSSLRRGCLVPKRSRSPPPPPPHSFRPFGFFFSPPRPGPWDFLPNSEFPSPPMVGSLPFCILPSFTPFLVSRAPSFTSLRSAGHRRPVIFWSVRPLCQLCLTPPPISSLKIKFPFPSSFSQWQFRCFFL